MKLAAEVTNYSNPAIQGNYDILIHSQDVAEFVPTMRPTGDIASTGNFHYQNVSGQPFLKSVAVEGQLTARGLTAIVTTGRLEVRNLRGEYRLADGSLRATGIEAEMLGGRVMATANVDHLEGTQTAHLQTTLRGISLRSLQRIVRRNELRQVTVSGLLD